MEGCQMWESLCEWAFGESTLIKVPKWNKVGGEIMIKVLQFSSDQRNGTNIYFDCRMSREI